MTLAIMCAISTLSGCTKNAPSYIKNCKDPTTEVEKMLLDSLWPDIELKGMQMVHLDDQLGGGDLTWFVAAWPDRGESAEPTSVDIAIWTTERTDGSSQIYSLSAPAVLSTGGIPKWDLATTTDLVGSTVVNNPINCVLHELGLK